MMVRIAYTSYNASLYQNINIKNIKLRNEFIEYTI